VVIIIITNGWVIIIIITNQRCFDSVYRLGRRNNIAHSAVDSEKNAKNGKSEQSNKLIVFFCFLK
jgi:hypothetical protein